MWLFNSHARFFIKHPKHCSIHMLSRNVLLSPCLYSINPFLIKNYGSGGPRAVRLLGYFCAAVAQAAAMEHSFGPLVLQLCLQRREMGSFHLPVCTQSIIITHAVPACMQHTVSRHQCSNPEAPSISPAAELLHQQLPIYVVMCHAVVPSWRAEPAAITTVAAR